MLETVVGKTRTAPSRNTILKSTINNFLLESVLDLTGADVAFSTTGDMVHRCLSDPIMNDLHNMVPMNPAISPSKLNAAR